MASTKTKRKKKKSPINIESYNRLLNENPILPELLEQMGEKFNFPIGPTLEIGTGTGTYLTKYLVLKERAKQIAKFYGMEPVSEFFEESKKHVVRLSRTDAVAHEFYGGNPFDVVTFSFVLGHIFHDKKKTFLQNIWNNLDDFDGGRLIVMDAFIPDYEEDEDRAKKQELFLQANIDFFKENDNQYMFNYFTNVLKEQHDDFFIGDHKLSIEKFEVLLKEVGFTKVEKVLFEGKGKANWKDMGYYFVVAEKEE